MTILTVAKMRDVALGAARSYLRAQGIDPVDASADAALAALDDVSRIDGALVAARWHFECDSENQTLLFRREWRRWQRESRMN